MYSPYQLAKKYLRFYRHAHNSKGHGVNSPFVYDFIENVKNSKEIPEQAGLIEAYRGQLLKDERLINVEDFGAGSHLTKGKERKVKDIAAASPKNKKFAQLLYRIARYYQCKNIIELGTSFGITTSYLASASSDNHVTTIEGSPVIAEIAQAFFDKAGYENISLIIDNFDDALPRLLSSKDKVDLLFIDGNHREEPTIRYFESFLPKVHNDTIFVFDDIHWSEEMERAWKTVSDHEAVTMTIDLFFIGLVFFKKEFVVKQHFSLRV